MNSIMPLTWWIMFALAFVGAMFGLIHLVFFHHND